MLRGRTILAGIVSVLAVAGACTSDPEGEGPSCTNGRRDAEEIGIDCGGVCAAKCTAEACAEGSECRSGKCEAGRCAAPEGKPCGVGTAVETCENGQPCELDKDCASFSCNGGTCGEPPPGERPPGPTDGILNNGETDVDCGGVNAPKCEDGKKCLEDGDCQTGYCPPSKVCAAPTYDDGVKNGDETDVDCGGTGPGMKKCAAGKACLADGDCVGACTYKKVCTDTPSCKNHHGGDTCGPEEVRGDETQEDCCRTLPVTGFTDPAHPGKTVYLDKYEITAGRVRAFIEAMMALNGGNIRQWIIDNPPAIWDPAWNLFMPSGPDTETVSVPHKPTSGSEAAPWMRNVGTNFQFNQQLFVYVHGHNCGSEAGSYGFPTFFYPADIQAAHGGRPRADPSYGDNIIVPAQEALDVKAMTCITSAMLQAFCHWDGGQLATDEVLDFVTGSPKSLGSSAGCGSAATGNRCAPLNAINASSDAGQPNQTNYYFPYYDNATAASPHSHEGVSRIAAPGRKMTSGPAEGVAIDTIRLSPGDEPWMDLHGNVHEIVLDVEGATFTGHFGLKYRGIGYTSARAGANSTTGNLRYPEYRAGYSGGRCMRFK